MKKLKNSEIDKILNSFAKEKKEIHEPEPKINPCNCGIVYCEEDEYLYCPKCARIKPMDFVSSYEEILKTQTQPRAIKYETTKHFNDALIRFQCKQSTDLITNDFIIQLKQNINENSSDTQIIKESEKILGKKQLHKHLQYIKHFLFGYNVYLSREQEERCIFLYRQISPVLKRYTSNRKNNINVNYLLYRVFQLLGYNNLLQSVKRIKGQPCIALYNSIWRKICEDLSYEYLPYK